MPARSTVHLWLATIEGFSDQYARACEIRADVYADQILEIADDASRDWVTKKNPDGSTSRVFDGEHVQRARLRSQRADAQERLRSRAIKLRRQLGDTEGDVGDDLFKPKWMRWATFNRKAEQLFDIEQASEDAWTGRREGSQGRRPRQHADGSAIGQARTGPKRTHGEDPRSDDPANFTGPRRGGDRVSMQVCQ